MIQNILKEEKQEKFPRSIAADLGLPARVVFKKNLYKILTSTQKRSIEVEKQGWEKIKPDIYGNHSILYRQSFLKDPLIKKDFFVLGLCYSETVYNIFRDVFTKSIWVRTNINVYQPESQLVAIEKINKIFQLRDNSSVIIWVGNDFALLNKSLKE